MRAGGTRLSRRWLFLGGLCLGFAVATRLEYVILLAVPVGMFLALCIQRELSGAVKWVCFGIIASAIWWSVYVHLFSPWRGSSVLQPYDLAALGEWPPWVRSIIWVVCCGRGALP